MLAKPNDILITAGLQQALANESEITLRAIGPQVLRNMSQLPRCSWSSQRTSRAQVDTPPPISRPVENAARAPTVAVLALSNLSGDVRNDHLCEGVSADIIFNLSRFRSLSVIARHSAFLFRAGAPRPKRCSAGSARATFSPAACAAPSGACASPSS